MSSRPSVAQLFAYPFRVFFLSVGVFAVVMVPIWLCVMLHGLRLPAALPSLNWHQHEMVFGLLDAAIAGFLLTAVCNWTGTARLHGARLVALWGVWFSARLAMALGAALPPGIAAAVDLCFLPLVLFDAGSRIVRARQRRQAVVLVVVGLLWLMDVAFHASADPRFVRGALLMAMALMLVIGGRITPTFSGNWLRLTGGDADAIRIYPWLEHATLGSVMGLLASLVLQAPGAWTSALALLASGLSTARLLLWQGWRTKHEPLLWILHLALSWIPVSLFLLAGNAAGCVPTSAWVHAMGAGAMASLILGVMSRVALGHTGRPLKLPAGMMLAFVAVLFAGVVRVTTALGWLPWEAGLLIAGISWTGAFTLYLVRYTSILASPRVDGKPG